MNRLRAWAWAALLLAAGQVVFGAIVRITGSGMGCGDHWPLCQGHLFPPLERPDLIIEVTHRYIAAAVSVVILAFVASAWRQRGAVGVGGPGGVLRPAVAALALVVAAALFGAVVVKLELANKAVIVTHLAIAMSLLAVLAAAVVRAGGPPPISKYDTYPAPPSSSQRTPSHSIASDWGTTTRSTARWAALAAGLAFCAVVLGALTANVPGANTACLGFPLCSGSAFPTDASQYLQYAHRVAAWALLALTLALSAQVKARQEPGAARWAWLSLTVVSLQVLVAAVMVLGHLPPLWRSLHEAVGTAAWVVTFLFAYAAHRATGASA